MDSTSATTISNSYYSWRNISLFLLLVATILLLSILNLNSITTSTSLSASKTLQKPSPKMTDRLEEVLERASMDDRKTVIIAVANKAYVDGEVMPNMLDIFLEGFWQGEGTRELVNHLVIVATDQMAYERCRFRGLHCYHLSTDGQDFMGEEVFMSRGFIRMMWKRTRFLIQVLKKGYNFIFTDMDVILLRNPFPILNANHSSLDIQFSTDYYNGNSFSTENAINTGFYFVKSNNKTISLFEKWYGLKDKYPRDKEQDVIQKMVWQGVLGELDIKFRFLETKFFCGFCQKTCDIQYVITMHANCCRFIGAKAVDLSNVLHEWVRFRAAPPNGTTTFHWYKHGKCKKSWQKIPQH